MEAELSVLSSRTFQIQKFPRGTSKTTRTSTSARSRVGRRCARPRRTRFESRSRRWTWWAPSCGTTTAASPTGDASTESNCFLRRHPGVPGEQHPPRRTGPQPHARGRRDRPNGRRSSALASRSSCFRSSTRSARRSRWTDTSSPCRGCSPSGKLGDGHAVRSIRSDADLGVEADLRSRDDDWQRALHQHHRASDLAELLEDAIDETRTVLRDDAGSVRATRTTSSSSRRTARSGRSTRRPPTSRSRRSCSASSR